MNNLEKLLSTASNLSIKIGEILKQSEYEEYDDLSGLQIDYDDEEQLLLLDEFKNILDKLQKAKSDIDYLNRPVVHTGYLHKNSGGRYETRDREFTCGNGIEALVYDDFYDKQHWAKTRVEHNGKDYYLVGYSNIPMEGLKVRFRK